MFDLNFQLTKKENYQNHKQIYHLFVLLFWMCRSTVHKANYPRTQIQCKTNEKTDK